jgi:hypothetical protein
MPSPLHDDRSSEVGGTLEDLFASLIAYWVPDQATQYTDALFGPAICNASPSAFEFRQLFTLRSMDIFWRIL